MNKEKWKNLRTTFVRSMKIPASGSRTKKPYYLNDAMQFTVPFIKTNAVPSGNLPPISLEENVESTDTWENNSLLNLSEITVSRNTKPATLTSTGTITYASPSHNTNTNKHYIF